MRVICCAASLAALAGCTTGTGEPDWTLPLTWQKDGTSLTLDEDGRAEVTDMLVGDVSCDTGVPEGERLSGRAQWEWDGYASFVVTIEEDEIGVDAAYYLGEPDWTRLLIDPCPDDPDVLPIELFLTGPFSAVGE